MREYVVADELVEEEDQVGELAAVAPGGKGGSVQIQISENSTCVSSIVTK